MGRLIDADDVKKLLVARYENAELIMKDVDRIKTAYDVDKVVEQLETWQRQSGDGLIAVGVAIEIVKGGGQGE